MAKSMEPPQPLRKKNYLDAVKSSTTQEPDKQYIAVPGLQGETGLTGAKGDKGDKKNGHIGIVLVHGFTGSPAAMRPWAEYLNARGYSVRVPLLPGHGTKPADLNEVAWPAWPAKVTAEITELQKHCSQIFVAGLSMGGGTTLHVAAELGDKLTGINKI